MADTRPQPSTPASGEGQDHSTAKAQWEPPRLTELPRLTDLTLLTGSGIIGGGSGSSTVF